MCNFSKRKNSCTTANINKILSQNFAVVVTKLHPQKMYALTDHIRSDFVIFVFV